MTNTVQDKTLDDYQDNEELFRKLREKPVVAWPTVILLLACLSAIASSWYFCLTDQLALWKGCLINCIAMYYLFSPMHDSMHNAVFRNPKLNAVVLAMTTFPIAPFTTGQFLRMMHMQHHRFTNDELDPDHVNGSKPIYALSLWFIWGHLYGSFHKKHQDRLPAFSKGLMRWDLTMSLASLSVLYFIPAEALLLMFIPSMVFSWLIALVFMYLPHRPHTVRHADDPYKATLIREGWEWLLCPLMAYQNYHLVHHLYPTVPFYRYRKVWNARKKTHMSHDPAIVRPLQLNPDNVPLESATQ